MTLSNITVFEAPINDKAPGSSIRELYKSLLIVIL
jgi:hypothetical protein